MADKGGCPAGKGRSILDPAQLERRIESTRTKFVCTRERKQSVVLVQGKRNGHFLWIVADYIIKHFSKQYVTNVSNTKFHEDYADLNKHSYLRHRNPATHLRFISSQYTFNIVIF